MTATPEPVYHSGSSTGGFGQKLSLPAVRGVIIPSSWTGGVYYTNWPGAAGLHRQSRFDAVIWHRCEIFFSFVFY